MKGEPLLGVFDSGVGGFSVLQELQKVTPANILYYGDCANAPYGNKSKEEITVYIKNILVYLKSQGVTHFVSACNSMSVTTTEELLEEIGITRDTYIDMIDGVRAIGLLDGANVLIIGTEATISSRVYQSILSEKIIPHRTYTLTTLAGEIEKGDTIAIMKSIEKAILYAKEMHATHILYACTHYPLVHTMFIDVSARLGWAGMFINPAVYVADLVATWKISGEHSVQCEASLETEVFISYRDRYVVVS